MDEFYQFLSSGAGHNTCLLSKASKVLNSFISNESFDIWFEDSEGNTFIPKGIIKINFIQKHK